MVIDTTPGDSVHKNVNGNLDVGIMDVNKEVGNLLPTRNILRGKEKQVMETINEKDFNKDYGEYMAEGLMRD